MNSDSMVQCVLLVLAVVLVGYLLMNSNETTVSEEVSVNEGFAEHPEEYFSNCGPVEEGFEDPEQDNNGEVEEPVNTNTNNTTNNTNVEEQVNNVMPSNPLGENEGPKGISANDSSNLNSLPAECYPKDVLNAQDLLPRDANSTYAQVAPSGQGCLQDKNFLTAGFHVGVNTVGQTLRNANRQLRSDPPNPQVKVSPWMQTTIEPDSNRKCFEVGCEQ